MKLGIFLDGTFIPERDGASARFAQLPRHLSIQGDDVTVFHCYRGWSDLGRIAMEPFQTHVFHPEVFYGQLDRLIAIVQSTGVNVIQMDAPETIRCLGIPIAQATKAKIVYEAHYHTSTVASALNEPPARVQDLRTLERDICREVDHIIVFTEADRDRWITLSGCPSDRISVVPFGVERVIANQDASNRDGVVFLGNLFYEPNTNALLRIMNDVVPVLRALRPNTPVTIIGDIPGDLAAECRRGGIDVCGEVSDPFQFLTRAAVGLAPVSESSGVRVKILQYLAAGLPVVSTTAAAEGLSFPAIFIENDMRDVAFRCADILSQPDKYYKYISSTQTIMREGLLWPHVAKVAAGVYANVMARPSRRRFTSQVSALPAPAFPRWIHEVLRKGRFANADMRALGGGHRVCGRGKLECHDAV